MRGVLTLRLELRFGSSGKRTLPARFWLLPGDMGRRCAMKTKRDAEQKDKHAVVFCTVAAERAYLLQSCSRFPNDSDALTFRADPPILQKCESADMRWINKARLSEHIALARVTDCE